MWQSQGNIKKKEHEKLRKYPWLEEEVKQMWELKTTGNSGNGRTLGRSRRA